MRAITIVMLVLQVAMLCAVVYGVLRRPTAARPRPVWSSFALSTLVVAMVSLEMVDRHRHDPGGELLGFGGAVMLGLSLAMSLVALWARRTDTAPAARAV